MGLRVNPRGRPPRQLEWSTEGDIPVLVSGGSESEGRVLSGDNLIRTLDEGPGLNLRVGLDPGPALQNGLITYSGDTFLWIPNTFVDSGDIGGVLEGRPGDLTFPLHTTPPIITRSVGSALDEPEGAIPARLYLNTSFVAAARLQLANWRAASDGTEVHLIYSTNAGGTWGEAGPLVSADVVQFPAVGAFTPLVSGAMGDNVLFTWGLKGGDGSTTVKIGNIYLDLRSAEAPESPDPVTPGGLPQGGPLGVVIHDLDSTQEVDDYADAASVTTMTDRAGYLTGANASVNGGIGQAAPTLHYTGFSGGLPCVQFDGVNDGLEVPHQLTGGSFTTYFVLDAISNPSGNYGTPWNGNVFPNGKGFLFEAGGNVGIYVNTTVPVPTYTSVADTWTKANKHIYAFAYSQSSGVMKLFVDDNEVITFSDGNLTVSTLATAMRIGAYSGVFPLAFKLGRVVTWNAAHFGTLGNPIRTVLRAYWGTP